MPTNAVELSAHAQRQAEIESGRAQAPRKHRTRDEVGSFSLYIITVDLALTRDCQAATSWGRTSLVSAASTTGLASKHSSLGPLPIFPRPPVHSLTRHAQLHQRPLDQELTTLVSEDRSDAIGPEQDHPEEVPPPRTITPSRPPKVRPTLASLFQSAGRKALRRDQFRKDSYRGDGASQTEEMVVSQSVPSTPLRRRFLGLMSNAGDTIRAAKSTPPPPMPLPPISMPTTFKGKENPTPPTPILKRKRSSLPIPPRHEHDHDHDHDHNHQQPTHQPSREYLDPNQFTLRRSKSDSRHGKRSHSPGQTVGTSIRVPGPPPQHHPHPHPYFPCDVPLDRGLLSLPSFAFERPVTRPSTPGQSQEFLPVDHTRRHKARAPDLESEMSAEIKSVLAAGTEARRERRAPSRERLRVIGPMHRQIIPDVTGGDDQLSPDAERFSQSVPMQSSRSKTHISHGLFAFESPASTPYGSRVDLPPTPPPSKPRKIAPPMPVPAPAPRSHHRHFSSSATAVAPAPPPKDAEMGLLKGFGSPRLFAGNKPHQERRMDSANSSYDKHQKGQRHGSLDSSRDAARSPTSYRHQPHLHGHGHGHGHGHSLSGSTVQNHYLTPAQSPAGLGIALYPPTREERYYDLREAMKLSIGESRYKSYERGSYYDLLCLNVR